MASDTFELAPEAALPDTLSLDDLAVALLEPHKPLLRDRLGLSATYETPPTEDREPLELDALEEWSLRARILEQLKAGAAGSTDEGLTDALHDRLSGEGALPLRAGGRAILEGEVEKARAVRANLAAVAGTLDEPLELSVQTDGGPLLVGRVECVVCRDGELLLQWDTPSKTANERGLMVAWLHLLAAIASGRVAVGARVVGHGSAATKKSAGGEFLAFDGGVEDARATLVGLVELWRLAHARPLPLFKKTSKAVAEALSGSDDGAPDGAGRASLVAKVADSWGGGYHSRGDIDDAWIAAYYVGYDPLDHLDDNDEHGLVALARRVWSPIMFGLQRGRDIGAAWLPTGDGS